MSIDLAVSDKINGTPQKVEDQDGGKSNLYLASDATTIGTSTPYEGGNGPASLTVYSAGGYSPLTVERPANDSGNRTCFLAIVGDEEAFRLHAYKNNKALNINVAGNQALQIDSSGNLTVQGTMAAVGMQPESSAPSGANLQAVYIDPDTGILYYHD